MKLMYQDIKACLRQHRVAFSVKGWKERHQDTDEIELSPKLQLEENVAILTGNTLFSMGAFSYTWSSFPMSTRIGRYCSIAKGVGVLGVRHPYDWISSSSFSYDKNFCIFDQEQFDTRTLVAPHRQVLEIGHDVWIGAHVKCSPHIKIGTGAVIAAHSVVVKDVQPYEIVGGNPARHIKWRFPEDIRQRLLALEWWQYRVADFRGLNIENPEVFIHQIERLKRAGDIKPYQPRVLTTQDLLAVAQPIAKK